MRPERRRMVLYDGHRWEVMDDRGTFLLIERGRGSYSFWIHKSLAEAT